jgi:hypothetical protein
MKATFDDDGTGDVRLSDNPPSRYPLILQTESVGPPWNGIH